MRLPYKSPDSNGLSGKNEDNAVLIKIVSVKKQNKTKNYSKMDQVFGMSVYVDADFCVCVCVCVKSHCCTIVL